MSVTFILESPAGSLCHHCKHVHVVVRVKHGKMIKLNKVERIPNPIFCCSWLGHTTEIYGFPVDTPSGGGLVGRQTKSIR